MTKTVIEQIKRIPKYWACHIPYIQTTGWAPTLPPSKREYSFISPICQEYLSKIDSLSMSYHFKWDIIPTFVAEHWHDSISHFNRQEYATFSYANKLNNYLDNIIYLNDSCFVDEVHLNSPKLYQQKIDNRLHLH